MSAPGLPSVGPFANPPGGFAPAPRPATRRNAELVLLAGAALLTVTGLVLVEAGQNQEVTWDPALLGLGFTGLWGVAHLAVRRLAPFTDPLLLPIVAALDGLGIVLIHRLDLEQAQAAALGSGPAPTADAPHQLAWTAGAIALFVVVLLVVRDYRSLASRGWLLGAAGLLVLALPAVLPARFAEVDGARLWLHVPGCSLQPGVFALLALVVFAASVLVARRELFTAAGRHLFGVELPRIRDLWTLLLVGLVSFGVLLFERDLGAATLVFLIALAMLYTATERTGWLLAGATLLAAGLVAGYELSQPIRATVAAWRDPFTQPGGYPVVQSLFGLATGGAGGTGLGSGRPSQVPLAKTEFIMAGLGEELGLIGLTAVLLLFTVLAVRGLRTAMAVRDSFGKLLAAGLSVTMVCQLFLVVGGVTRILPRTGLPTPFLSYGGSALLADLMLIALLARISDSARAPAPGRKRETAADATGELPRHTATGVLRMVDAADLKGVGA